MSNFNPLNHLPSSIRDINFNPLGLDLNPLNVDFAAHRDRVVNFFQHGTEDLNSRMQSVVHTLRSNDYKKRMHRVLTKIKETKEYQSTNMTDYDVIFESVDMYSNLQIDPTLDKDEVEVVKDFTSYKKRFKHWIKKERISTILFVPILGFLIAIMGILCDFVLKELDLLRRTLVPNIHSGMYDWVEGVVFVSYSVALAFISVCCISFISPYAVGSGIPEMKSILSGINLSRVLGWKTLVSKLLGMVCATAAGLTIGRTGPFMHASAIIAQQMMQLNYFSNIKKNMIVRYQMLICALASGVVANFGAPIGGLLFSIEVTATNCLFGNLWKGLLSGTTTAIIFYLTRGWMGGTAFTSVYKFDFVLEYYGWIELLSFVGIGIITGLIGAIFVFLYEKIVRFRLRYQFLRQSRIGLVVVVAFVSAVITYLAGPFARKPLSYAMKQLIHIPDDDHPDLRENTIQKLLIFIAVKLFLTAFNIVLPIPGGAITPFIVTGAALGRLFGELLKHHLSILPAGYAVIASAGLVSGAIRAIAPSIFVLELTGQLSMLIPVLICSITSAAVGNFFNKPLFDTALKIQGLPFLSSYRSEKVYSMTAKHVMRTELNFLSMRSTINEIQEFLSKFKYTFIPIVDSNVGIVERTSIMDMVDVHIEHVEEVLGKIHGSFPQNNINDNNNSILVTDQYNNNLDENNNIKNNEKERLIDKVDEEEEEEELEPEEENNQHDNIDNDDNLEDIPLVPLNNNDQDNNNNNNDENNNLKNRKRNLIPLQDIVNNNNINNENIEEGEIEGISGADENSNQQHDKDNIKISINEETTRELSKSVWGGHILGDIINSGETAILMDLAPSQIPDLTPLNKVFHLFTMLGLSFTYVTSFGKLVGVITKTDLISKQL
eukprot:gene4041-5058_t